jgi:hypothetical protein
VVPGVTLMPMTGAISDTFALADFVESAALVPVTTAVVFVVTEGAVYAPLLEIVPTDAVQFTAVLEVFVMVAEN